MRPSEALQLHREEVRAIALSHRVCNVRVFGSVLNGEDTEESDIDFLVDPTPETTLMDIAHIQGHLQSILGVNVDVLTPKAIPLSFREKVLSEAAQV